MNGRAAALVSALALAALAAGCEESRPTEIVLTIDGDPVFSALDVEVDGVLEAETPLPTAGGENLPITVTLVRGGDRLGPFRVRAIGYVDQEAEASACAYLSFASGRSTTATLVLTSGTFAECPSRYLGDAGPDAAGAGDAGDAGDVSPSPCDPVACAALDPSAVCDEGRCRFTACQAQRADCSEPPGCETRTTSDERHCGGCDMPCAPGESCNGGVCG